MTEKFNRTDFLGAIFGAHIKESGNFILIRTIEEGGFKASTHFYPNTTQLSITEFAPNRHVYLGVCPREKMNPGKEHIRYATALWAGIDIGPGGYSGINSNFADFPEARKSIESFPVPPSIIVQSGRGLHLYWLLDSPKEITNVEIVENLLRKLNSHFRCGSPVGVDSTLRLPGTWNPRGYRTSVRCWIEHLDSELRYSPRDFQDLDRRLIRVSSTKTPTETKSDAPIERTVQPRLPVTKVKRALEVPAKRFPLHAVTRAGPVPGTQPPPPVEPVKTLEPEDALQDHEKSPKSLTEEDHCRLADDVADRIAQRFLDNHADMIVQKIVDKVVEKLVERIWFPRDG